MPCNWITGVDGFIGRNLGRLLMEQGQRVCALGSDRTSDPGGQRHERLVGRISSDLLDEMASRQPLPETIFHLAGGSSVGSSLADPLGDFESTVVSTAIVLEWMRSAAPRARLVYVSSAAVYGNGHSGPIPEGAATRPYSPYGTHKLMAEMLCKSALDNFGVDFVTVRPFSIFGVNLRKQLLWDCCNKLRSAPASLELGGTGNELRDWLPVDDLTAILARVAHRDVPPGIAINAGSGHGVAVKTIVGWLTEAFGMTGLPVNFSGQSRPGDPASLIADVTQLASYGISIPSDLREYVNAYVTWFRSL